MISWIVWMCLDLDDAIINSLNCSSKTLVGAGRRSRVGGDHCACANNLTLRSAQGPCIWLYLIVFLWLFMYLHACVLSSERSLEGFCYSMNAVDHFYIFLPGLVRLRNLKTSSVCSSFCCSFTERTLLHPGLLCGFGPECSNKHLKAATGTVLSTRCKVMFGSAENKHTWWLNWLPSSWTNMVFVCFPFFHCFQLCSCSVPILASPRRHAAVGTPWASQLLHLRDLCRPGESASSALTSLPWCGVNPCILELDMLTNVSGEMVGLQEPRECRKISRGVYQTSWAPSSGCCMYTVII